MRSADERVRASLRRVRYELVPMRGVDGQLRHLPPDAVVSVTSPPGRDIGVTLDLAARIVARGHIAVPHLAARQVASGRHLDEILERLRSHGIDEVLAIAGAAAEPAGPYEGAADLLGAIAERPHGIARIGITGYPQGHPFAPGSDGFAMMARKAPYADHVVTQICYDPEAIRSWIDGLRAAGIALPIVLGIPGVIARSRLPRVALRIGVVDSLRYLRSQPDVAARLVAGYEPDPLVDSLADLVDDPVARVTGWHVSTFNEVQRTERWRQEQLAIG